MTITDDNRKELFISFDITDKTSYAQDRKKISSIMNSMLPNAKEVDSNFQEEIIYALNTPDVKDLLKNRVFLLRLKSVFLQAQEFAPHFTTYVV